MLIESSSVLLMGNNTGHEKGLFKDEDNDKMIFFNMKGLD